MKARIVLIAIMTAAIALMGFGPADHASAQRFERGDVVVSSTFYHPLAPYGRWFTIPRYGFVWSPFNVAAGWGPYVDGSWAYTDDGWTWVSDDPWGWATCHYGRWFFDPVSGWVWVPGTDWAPAWVDWTYGDGFIGWAPLSPAFAFGLGGFSYFAPIPVVYYRFVRDRDFDDDHVNRFLISTRENDRIFSHTHRVTNMAWADGRVVNRSLSRQTVERAVGHPIRQRTIRSVGSAAALRGTRVQGNQVTMFRPAAVRANRTQSPTNGQTRAQTMNHAAVSPQQPARTPSNRQQERLAREQAQQRQEQMSQRARQQLDQQRQQARQQQDQKRILRDQQSLQRRDLRMSQAQQMRQSVRSDRQFRQQQMRQEQQMRQPQQVRQEQQMRQQQQMREQQQVRQERQMRQEQQVRQQQQMRPVRPAPRAPASRPMPSARPPMAAPRAGGSGGFRGMGRRH